MELLCNYRCGHTHKVAGPIAEEAAAQAPEQYCMGCVEFHRRKGFYPIVEKELTTLEGSEKQIAWAIKLRNERVDMINNHIERGVRQGNNTPEEIERVRTTFVTIINQQPQAKWYIDSRDRPGLKPFAEAYEKAYASLGDQ